nr:T9SS type A sorting domain-containing protein [Saprospiraceae bacterium]
SDGQSGAIWVLNRDYNHEMVKNGFLPKPINAGVITVNDVINTDYKVSLFETLSGDILSTSTVTANDGKLNIKLPAMEWDLAIKFDRADLTSTKDITLKTMEIYPNPVEGGGIINIVCEDFIGKLQASVFNAEGRLMVQENVQSDGRFSIRLNGDITAGIYFVKLNNDRGEAVVKGIVVSE